MLEIKVRTASRVEARSITNEVAQEFDGSRERKVQIAVLR
jgi:hypothetical protein